MLLILLVAIAAFFGAPAAAASPAVAETPADLVYLNRTIYTMRVTIAGAPPQLRAERALERIRGLDARQARMPIAQELVTWNGEPAIALRIEDRTLLTVFPRDVDPDEGATLEGAAMRTQMALEEALRARVETERPAILYRGAAWSLVALLGLAGAVWALLALGRRLLARIHDLVGSAASNHRFLGIDWSDYAFVVIARLLQFALIVAVLAMGAAWLGFAFDQFPATAPLAESMDGLLRSLARDGGLLVLQSLPDVGMMLLVLLAARGVTWVLASIFDGVSAGRIAVPGLHAETVPATRRLSMLAVWGLALAALYPFIPGSQSDVFRALSVFVGFVVTLGSTGVMSQMMGGVVLIYARALRVGDFVRVGQVEGVVSGLGTLSVKIRNYRGDEVTVPNSAVVADPIENYTRRTGGRGARASLRVSIGYDTPWRQVYAILERAAAATPGIAAAPAPQVIQRALNDFHVDYELLFSLNRPDQRVFVLSRLHEAVLDGFNAEGVQVMSPHFQAQPGEKVIVPHGPWFPGPEGERGEDVR